MSTEITMPKLSDTMEEGTVLEWRIQPGDKVRQGDIIAEVETDKAAMEMEAFEDGVVSEIRIKAGETVAVGTVIAVFAAQADEAAPPDSAPIAEVSPAAAPQEPEQPTPVVAKPPLPSSATVRPAVSPVARKRADDLGVNLTTLTGSGPDGRIVLEDIERVSGVEASPGSASSVSMADDRKQARSVKIRRIMARKMTEAWTTIPHFYVTYSIDMTDVIRFRKDLGTTINDFVLTAVARTLQEHPWVNSWWVDGESVEQPNVNIAMAVATDRGLYNPVLKNCARLSLKEISRQSALLADKAHSYRLAPEDLEEGTFTISNMGMLGVESFRAIITPPQAAVLAVGTVRGEVVVDEHGEPAVAPIARMTLAADHRILDGADAAEFMMTLKSYLEAPVTLVSCDYGEDDI